MRSFGRTSQRGFSLVETMVGIAIGLLVIAGALNLFTRYLGANQRLAQDARVQQDLRVAGDIIARDLRRAGYWRGAVDATLSTARPASHQSISMSGAASAAQINYSYTGNLDGLPKDDAAGSNEAAFRLNAGVVEMKEGNSGWQDITDPNSVRVVAFAITPHESEISLGNLCSPVCTSASAQCPSFRIRSYDIAIRARATADASVVRETRESVHIRNDDISRASCPP